MDRPWFKFTANNWLSGSVQLLDAAEKGTYIDLIAMIWKEGGKLENSKILHRKLRLDYATACDRINSYCDLDILVCEDNFLSIKFLDDQINSYKTTCENNAKNAAKRWDKEPKPMRPDANKKRREEKREEEKEIKTKEKKGPLPSFIDQALWNDWMEIREKKKAINSDRAIAGLIKKLEEVESYGKGRANFEMGRSIENSWKSIFPDDKSTLSGTGKTFYAGQSVISLNAIVDKMRNHQATTQEIDIFAAATKEGFKPNE